MAKRRTMQEQGPKEGKIKMPAEALKTERIEARVRPADKAFIEDAANYLGISVADFLISTARERAEDIIRRRNQIELSRRDQEAFVNALLNPPQPTTALKAAVESYDRSVQR